jgi:putative DeoR family transcriptional regulator (stage III sporulation protein D)
VNRQEWIYLNTGIGHIVEEMLRHPPASHIVIYNSHFYSLTSLFHQRISNHTAKRVFFPNIHINMNMYGQCRNVLEKNKAERHIRGGLATREKYKQQALHSGRQ